LEPCSCTRNQERSTGKGKQTAGKKGTEKDLVQAHIALAYSGTRHELRDIDRSLGVHADSRHYGTACLDAILFAQTASDA
jgi:hypothetical protein